MTCPLDARVYSLVSWRRESSLSLCRNRSWGDESEVRHLLFWSDSEMPSVFNNLLQSTFQCGRCRKIPETNREINFRAQNL